MELLSQLKIYDFKLTKIQTSKKPASQIDHMTFVYLLSQAYDIALLSQNSRPCHMAGDMAEKTSQN